MTRNFIQVITTVDSQEGADMIAKVLVKERLAGCVQIAGPVTSRYRWEGEVRNSEEWLIIAKSHMSMYPKVEKCIREQHPYDEPEVIAIPICAASKSYLNWLEKEMRIAK